MASGERTDPTPDATGAQAGTGTAPRAEPAEARAAGAGDQEGRRQEIHAGLHSGPVAAATPLERITISCLTNTYYHACREVFLDTVHRWFMFLVSALGTGALTDLLPKLVSYISVRYGTGMAVDADLVKEVCAAGAAILAALDLTFDLSNRARAHAMMRRRYFELLAKVRAEKMDPAEAAVCLDEFSADEEPPYHVLHLVSWNEAQRSVYGKVALQFQIGWLSDWFKNWWRRPGADFGKPTQISASAI
jgi:hypothetical protein